ncbi:hypothetical protein KJY73_16620 [Bowmanella sp. Y26]|uniref:hypothetical protein n=1 Tax=Bowmanella yangjiangensis TaxID=2811230 RepID=UPI001BDDB31D|nr:hypothetical protein [Bowmanella yangjiangensis]MBT1065216.1 hypothetical protein [Bowmanella yangjiangensis]
MSKLSKIAKGLSAAMLLSAVGAVQAETVSVPATVSVDNTIGFALTGTLDFGTVRATPDSTSDECSGIVMPANPASSISAYAPGAGAPCITGAGDSEIQSVGGTPTRPQFDITGVAAFATLNVNVPSAAVNLTTTAPAGSPGFQLIDFTAYKSSGTPGAISLTAGAGTISVDGTGAATFTVGATLITDPTAYTLTTATYENAAYNGSFDVSVTY